MPSKLSQQWQENLVGFLRVGNLLLEAKGRLPFEVFWDKLVEELLPFDPPDGVHIDGRRRGPAHPPPGLDLSKPAHVKRISQLPPAVGTLYELHQLKDHQFERYLKQGIIHPGLKRKEAKLLVQTLKTRERHVKAARQNVGKNVSLWLADPPWKPSYRLPYPTMELDAIKALRPGPRGRVFH